MFPVRELVKSNVSLHTARDASDSSFKIAVTQDDQVSEIQRFESKSLEIPLCNELIPLWNESNLEQIT